ncbi:MAG: class I SAM-dependent methyltransferase, partial [Nitrososphaeria archaeon]
SEFGFFIEGNYVDWLQYQYHVNRYLFASNFVIGKTVLDVACGTGYGSMYLAKEGANLVVAGDLSSEALSYAKVNYKSKSGPEFIRLDATHLPFVDDSFDCVITFETIEHLKEYERFIKECRRILKIDGILISSTPNKRTISPIFKQAEWVMHIKEFYPEELYLLFKKYFSKVEIFGQHFLGKKGRVIWLLRSTFGGLLKRISSRICTRISSIIFPLEHRAVNFSLKDIKTLAEEKYAVRQADLLSATRNIVIVARH